MAAAAHNRKFAEKADIPQSVAKEFNKADKKQGRSNRMQSKMYSRKEK
jgi:hypothetical protein